MPSSKPKTSSTARTKPSSVRIIGGSMRGRKINFSSGEGLRPTLDRIRETVFNWLATDIPQSTCLDLFAGSGALGFEAVSRGAKSVIFVDSSSQASVNLRNNLEIFKVQNAKVVNQKAKDFLTNNRQKFDLVFLDPPFGRDLLPATLEALTQHLNSKAIVYVEQEAEKEEPVYPANWDVIKSKKTSRFFYQLIKLKEE